MLAALGRGLTGIAGSTANSCSGVRASPLTLCRGSLAPIVRLQQQGFATWQPGQRGTRRMRFSRMGTTLVPSLWKWYHRHGYWATRKKNLHFTKKRPHKFHLAVGFGKRANSYKKMYVGSRKDNSYYKPIKNYCRF
ncbi:hypothetical protein FOZ63_011216 [Perkinsus olseni]|uniref:39S ribosomal protein L35, mitochondrial n=1 Tax=Perkinsus olseni TaxID=32597 RepID=A0A7J6SKH3_PEROL|nr:hypothetical protein FOZ63_011216 [Perkinsus olseni]